MLDLYFGMCVLYALSPSMSITAGEHIELSPLRQFTKQNMTQLTDAACISVVTDRSTTMEKSTSFLPNLEDRVQTNIKLTDYYYVVHSNFPFFF